MGRYAQPVDILTANGRKHLTKAEIQERKDAEVKIGKKLEKSDLDKLKPPSYVKDDAVAFACWKDCIKQYKLAAEQKVDLLTSSDVGMLAMYCKTYSEYQRLLNAYQRIDSIAADCEPLQQFIFNQDEYVMKAMRQMSNILSIEGLLRIETAVNKKMDMLIKMQDRLFLNPLAKVKNVPKPKKDEKPPSKFAKYGGGRSG